MQVVSVRALPDGGKWTYEAKLDGYRCLAAKRDGRVVLWSRSGNGFTARFLQIARACEKLPADTLIDGEVIAADGRNVLRLPIKERRLLLTEALRKVEYPVVQSVPFDVKPAELIRAFAHPR